MGRVRFFRLLRVTALALAAWAGSFQPALAANLHPGDVLDIVIFDHPELSGPATVSNDGFVSVPLAGRVRAVDGDEKALRARIKSALSSVLYMPAVDVRVHTASTVVTFAGEATGSATLKPGDTLANALAAAKLSPAADPGSVTVQRDGRPLTDPPVTPATLLAGGDVITVAPKPVAVVVSGALKPSAPGDPKAPSTTVYLGKLQPLGDALAAVTLAADADLLRITLKRTGRKDAVIAPGAAQLAAPALKGDGLVVDHVANVTLLGAVSKQGPVVLRGDHSLASALALAGGPAKDGDASRITVVRLDETKLPADMATFARTADPAGNPALEDGDVVYVPKVKERFNPLKLVAALLAAKTLKIPK